MTAIEHGRFGRDPGQGFWSSTLGGVVGLCAFVVAMAVFATASYHWLGAKEQILFPVLAAFYLAIVTPVTIVAIRHQVRRTRIKLIDLFAKNFNFETGKSGGDDKKHNVSFEFVKDKYFADLDMPPGKVPTIADVPRFPMMLHADWMLLLCAIPYMVLSWFGALLLLAPQVEVFNIASDSLIGSWLWPSMLSLGGASAEYLDPQSKLFQFWHVNVLTVALIAFSGAYFFTVRLLLRAVAVFDLSAITFLRAFSHIVLAMLLAVIVYRVFPTVEQVVDGVRNVGETLGLVKAPASTAVTTPSDPCAPAGSCLSGDPRRGVSVQWFLIAFAFGFLPDAAIEYALKRAGLTFKSRYSVIDEHTKIIPVTILDGVDHFVGFRLEEANIFDVQNLATANPIMLHIESPFGIYETIDWVAQAQLCTVAGPDRFLLFKSLNLRTIFDLERAVLPDSDEARRSLNPALVEAVGRILLRDTKRDGAMRTSLDLGGHVGAAMAGGQPAEIVAATQALVRVMIDDLHVHRLRQVWKHIDRELGKESMSF